MKMNMEVGLAELKLTDKQLAALEEYRQGSTLVESCRSVGYRRPNTAASQLRQSAEFAKALQLVDNSVRLDLRNLGITRLREILSSETASEKVRLDAAKYAIFLAGVEEEIKKDDGLNKPPSEMSLEDLAQKVMDLAEKDGPETLKKLSSLRNKNSQKRVASMVLKNYGPGSDTVQ